MQYAVVQNRLLAADEYRALMTHGTNIFDRVPPDRDMSLKIVYGSLKPQVGETPLDAMDQTRETRDCWYGTVREDQCLLSTLLDIEFHKPLYRGLAVDIPFAALLRTGIEIGHQQKRSIPCFVRYEGMSAADNLLDRPAILCLYRQEGRPKGGVTDSGWRDAIRPQRLLQCARNCI